jgi:cleavage stimulation factor subunit 3
MTDITREMEFLNSLTSDSTIPPESHIPSHNIPDDEDDDDYDPTSFITQNAGPVPDKVAVPTSTAPRFGGFEIDEDDDEDENEAGPAQPSVGSGANGFMGGNTHQVDGGLRASSEIPSKTQSPVINVQHPTPASVLENRTVNGPLSSYGARHSSSATPLPKSPTPPTALGIKLDESSNAPSSFFQKARLPQDRVGTLEDRIAEDPRGDVDAWLELISEHRNRNRFDQAREVYSRFFKVFPTAVSVQ